MNLLDYKILKRTMKSIGHGLRKLQGFGIMIMTNIHSFGKLYRHSYVSGRYPRTKILKEKKYMQRWKFNGLHQMLSLHKKGIVSDPDNYRGISLVAHTSKILCGIIRRRAIQVHADAYRCMQ